MVPVTTPLVGAFQSAHVTVSAKAAGAAAKRSELITRRKEGKRILVPPEVDLEEGPNRVIEQFVYQNSSGDRCFCKRGLAVQWICRAQDVAFYCIDRATRCSN